DEVVKLNLRFPGCDVATTSFVNDAEYTYFVKDPQFSDPPEGYSYPVSTYVQLSDEEPPKDEVNKLPIRTVKGSKLSAATAHASRLAMENEVKGDYWYYSSYNNSMKNTKRLDVMILDDTLDPRLKFYSFNLSTSMTDFKGTATVEYRDASTGIWLVFDTLTADDFIYSFRQDSMLDFTPYPDGDRRAFIDGGLHSQVQYTEFYFLPSNVVCNGIRVLFSEVEAQKAVYLDAGARLRDPNEFWKDVNTTTTYSFSNKTTFYANWQSTNPDKPQVYIDEKSAFHDIVPYAPKFRGMKVVSGITGTTVFNGNKFTVNNRIRFYDFDTDDTILYEGGQIIDILPPGIMYVPGSMSFTNLNGQTLKDSYDNIEPIIVYDYMGTGETALIWNLKDALDISYFRGEYQFYYSYQVEVLETCNAGTNTLRGYYNWPETRIIGTNNNQSASGIYKGYTPYEAQDGYGASGLQCEIQIDYKPPIAVVAAKGVKGSYNGSYLYAPATGYSAAGSDASYRLFIANYSENVLESLSALDVLPYIGDKALVQNQTGTYVDRKTEFDVPMSGPVQVVNVNSGLTDNRFMVVYSKTDPEPWNGIDDYKTHATWLTESQVGTDWDEVRAFEIVLRNGETLDVGDAVYAYIPIVMPDDGLKNEEYIGKLAYNSYALDIGRGYLEAIKSGIEIVDWDVSISKTAEFTHLKKGDEFVYTLKVTNERKEDATGTTVTDILPPQLKLVGTSHPYTIISYQDDDPSKPKEIEFDIGTLTAMSTVNIKLTCVVEKAALFISNSAKVRINEDDNDEDNDDDIVVITAYDPESDYDVSISKSANKHTYKKGEDILYTLRIENNSFDPEYEDELTGDIVGRSISIDGVVVVDLLPAELTFEDFEANTPEGEPALVPLPADVSLDGNMLTINIGDMDPDEIIYITIRCSADAIIKNMTNMAFVLSDEEENDYDDSTDEEEIDIVDPGTLIINKTHSGAPEDWGITDSTIFQGRVKVGPNQYMTVTGVAPNYVWSGSSTTGSYISFSEKNPAEIIGIPVGTYCEFEEFQGFYYEADISDGVEFVGLDEEDEELFEVHEITVDNEFKHDTGSIIVTKDLDGFIDDWSVGDLTAFQFRIKDISDDENINYVFFTPKPDGTWYADGNSGSAVPSSDSRELVTVTAGKQAILTNLWMGTYVIEEVITGTHYTVIYHYWDPDEDIEGD
ncbi:MAG: DUF11 domain-containing protein, partial [Oscillospiraceae bacterium]|nr:DUF11 domain-containing protein [Oscillospiraceae bacterium]